jgi:hypothetical protein
MSDSQVTLILPQEQVEALARRVAALIEEGRDDGSTFRAIRASI